MLKQILRNKSAIVGLIIIFILILVAIFADYLVPHDPYQTDLWENNRPPEGFGEDAEYILGTDDLGRDVLSRIIMGTRISLFIALSSIVTSMIIGVFLGSMAGYVGGKVDTIIMRIMDVILSFPAILLAIAIVASLGPGMFNAMWAIAITRVPQMARITRSRVISLKETEYVEAARALGASHTRIIIKHILVNSFAPILVITTLGLGSAIVIEAALSFLGLGTQPPAISWGRMLAMARQTIRSAPYLSLYPGLAIVFTVLGFNLLGDGLRDIFDPSLDT